MTSSIRDNRHRGSVGQFLKSTIKPGAQLSIVSAYFTIYAFQALMEKLQSIGHLDFLFGEPRFVRSLDPERTEKKSFRIEVDHLELTNQLLQKQVARACAEWIAEKVDIRSITTTGLLHGKLYHIDNAGVEQALLGSSNFTVRGLGLAGTGNNIELNMVVDSDRDRRDLKEWFLEIWNEKKDVVDVKQEVLSYLAQIYVNHSPEFIYYKTLFHLFEQFIDEQNQSDLLAKQSQITETLIWRSLFEFQRDGAKGAISKILRYNGCIIADSVGLGKTYEALAVIKFFELRNERVLVLCPKKLRENWTVYQAQNNSTLNPFISDRFGYTVLSHTDLSRDQGLSGDIDLSTFNWGAYGLVVIDESHNFRNNARGRRDEDGNVIRRTRYERLMEDIIKQGLKTKVLLLSATPVNNDLKDLRNQLFFMTEDQDNGFSESLGIGSLRDTLAAAQRTFSEWAKLPSGRTTDALMARLSATFFTLLDGVTIARSRKHIQNYYRESVVQLGGFPKRMPPRPIYPEIDTRGSFMPYDAINDEISRYKLALYSPSFYILPAHRAAYASTGVRNFSQTQRETYLIGMMKVNFLKRLESSISAFALTMQRTLNKVSELELKIVEFLDRRDASTEYDADAIRSTESEDEELRDALEVGKGIKFKLAHLDVERWLADLRHDKRQLSSLADAAKEITSDRDAKLAELKTLISAKVRNPPVDKRGNPNRKILVFTAFADTAAYLYRNLHVWARYELGIETALVSGGVSENKSTFGEARFNQILTNFSPVSKRRELMPSLPQSGCIDLLIATDCISEGQNLQDCDLVVNYDIHWNPVRIIQRFGRIDRIGSINHSVEMVNFWPTQDLNKYLNLKNRVEARMALVDLTATGDDDLLAEQLGDLVADELRYRDKQLLRLQHEVLDLEEFDDSVTLTDFSLEDFRRDLAHYIERNREVLSREPGGLYGVVSHTWSPLSTAQPGVIFCLQQKTNILEGQQINPLQPFYLVYVLDSGAVRLSFAQPKQTLEIFRDLCLGRTEPDEALCLLFDQETTDGNAMAGYSQRLLAAVDDIIGRSRRRAAANITSSRNALLAPEQKQARSAGDFDLVTWLVIKDD